MIRDYNPNLHKDNRGLEKLLIELDNSKIRDGFDDELKDLQYYERMFSSKKDGDLVLFTYYNQIEGFLAGLKRFKERIYDIHMLYVGEEYRHQGIAMKLKNEGIKRAKEKGAIEITTMVLDTNYPIIELNRKMGWKEHSYPDSIRFYKNLK